MICKIILNGDLQDQDIKAEAVRALSFHRYNFPLVDYRFIKLLRYQLGVEYPSWNYQFYDSRCFNSEMQHSQMLALVEIHRNKVSEVYSAIKSSCDLEIYTFVDWENTGTLDIAFSEHRVGVILDTKMNPITDRAATSNENRVLANVMRLNGWQIIELNYFEFQEGGVDKLNEVVEQLKSAYAEAVET